MVSAVVKVKLHLNFHEMWQTEVFIYIWYLICTVSADNVDPKGYILYCPCMGRFGNQADHFLGSLAWAKAMDRTLVLPPWVEYSYGKRGSEQVPFKKYFNVSAVASYHRVITMEHFMETLAPTVWPIGKRTVYCYMERSKGHCNAKDGNPFGPFWDNFNVDFDNSEFYGPLQFSGDDPFELDRWRKKFPVKDHLVMAFMGAPAPFPVSPHNRRLQKYLKWSDDIQAKVDEFIKDNLILPFVGIHLRLGVDWKNACAHVEQDRSEMFASSQCLGDRNEHGRLYYDLCYPPDKIIISQVSTAVNKYAAKSVYIATDSKDLMQKFQQNLPQIKFVRNSSSNPHVDLAIVARSQYAIVNCVSTFSSFITRERAVNNLQTGFWAFPKEELNKQKHDDL